MGLEDIVSFLVDLSRIPYLLLPPSDGMSVIWLPSAPVGEVEICPVLPSELSLHHIVTPTQPILGEGGKYLRLLNIVYELTVFDFVKLVFKLFS